ncbi:MULTISPECIES: tyrosine-type recombinase/integrase [Gordonibacter]|uniref:Tyrosine-type recombinase/integrase n=1 Tax=Gordonibacter faecis TaxID=3047475 RepID=A0ABT7DS62_9ACTN|nr:MULTISPECIES: tyrosine-type recombinase/integrase [unclassified Gordonibacter]MDJ1651020.1 tyrosine-type recombinase/integrase [Gordonibacter sp. KGMB12511]HIW77281.1 tyrosine-type recombinase/integrase [Candidatus Gordonibacter avicola]
MTDLTSAVAEYLTYCQQIRRLNAKTIKAYRCDLRQFEEWLHKNKMQFGERAIFGYLAFMNATYAPSSAKRKIASIRAFSAHLYSRNRAKDPFNLIEVRIKEPKRLPRTIPLVDLKRIIGEPLEASDDPSNYIPVRNKMIAELLIASGIRISELCSLDEHHFDSGSRSLLIMGKGSKERMIQIESDKTLSAFAVYLKALHAFRAELGVEETSSKALFINRFGARLTEQSARNALNRLTSEAGVLLHVTPHMFRHTFATMLLEGDVDIRYIQALLGHSSVKTTEIYTHVTSTKLREIMKCKNPRDLVGGPIGTE